MHASRFGRGPRGGRRAFLAAAALALGMSVVLDGVATAGTPGRETAAGPVVTRAALAPELLAGRGATVAFDEQEAENVPAAHFKDVRVDGTGNSVLSARVKGSATFENVDARDIGAVGVNNCGSFN
ncbi:hypothetical protein [Streptomyces roseolus]|uniref:hypothetical protein n=1 Tax=Streptomyces roseolus TaxID=67358 RepID=UPI0037A0A122